MRGTRTGVQRPSSPASVNVGCSALFGQTFMHSPQRMQRDRKNSSSSAPGGRSKRSCRSAANPGVLRTRGTSAAPAASPVRTLRRCRFAPTVFWCGKELELQAVFRTLIHTIQTQVTFRLMPRNAARGIVPALAAQQASVAIVAVLRASSRVRAPTSETRSPTAPRADKARGTRTA